MSIHVSSVSSFDFPSDKIIIADINFFVKLDTAERYAIKKPPEHGGGIFRSGGWEKHIYNLREGETSDQPGITISRTAWRNAS